MTNGEAINWIINISADIGKAEHRDLWHYEQALSEIREMLETAQPEPQIVRCKDCKHRVSYWGNCKLLEEKYRQSVLVDGDEFCSMAERRTDG